MENFKLKLLPSRTLLVYFLVVHCAAISVIVYLGWSWWLQLIASIVVLFSAIFMFSRTLLVNTRAIFYLEKFSNSEQWFLVRKNGSESAFLKEKPFITPFFIILCFDLIDKSGTVRVLVAHDSLSVLNYRRLCRHLRFADKNEINTL